MFGMKRKMPKRPAELDEILALKIIPNSKLIEYNDIAMKVYNDSSLSKCPNWKRTFNLESLQVHLKSCNKKHGTDSDPFNDNRKRTERPRGIMCYICGREYFSKSINIHLKQCKERFIREENLKPK